ncbi:hypothetical protein [Ensifer sp.]|jgi:uncharacterized Zn finger protein|uniref:hypothetical protein n=1 Tax=Ensifer sp. TaxID=1872086 RepID=UPI002E0E0884|nr:hypothetical protein [Ensifer sp.]
MFNEIDIPCPECGHENSQRVAWVKANDELPCEQCGSAIALEDEKHLLVIEQATANIAKLRRSLAKFRNYSTGATRKRR